MPVTQTIINMTASDATKKTHVMLEPQELSL